MSLSIDAQREILLADFARFQAREGRLALDPTSRAGIEHAQNDRKYMRGFGMIPANESKRKTPRRVPRLSHAESTSDCIVTTPDGNRYTIKRGRDRTSHTPKVDVDRLNKIQAAQAHKVTASDLAPIGNVD